MSVSPWIAPRSPRCCLCRMELRFYVVRAFQTGFNWRLLGRFLGPYRRQLILLAAILAATITIQLVTPLVAGRFVDDAITGSSTESPGRVGAACHGAGAARPGRRDRRDVGGRARRLGRHECPAGGPHHPRPRTGRGVSPRPQPRRTHRADRRRRRHAGGPLLPVHGERRRQRAAARRHAGGADRRRLADRADTCVLRRCRPRGHAAPACPGDTRFGRGTSGAAERLRFSRRVFGWIGRCPVERRPGVRAPPVCRADARAGWRRG